MQLAVQSLAQCMCLILPQSHITIDPLSLTRLWYYILGKEFTAYEWPRDTEMTVVDAVESQTPQVCRLVAENLDLQFSEDCICPRAPAHREWKVPGNAVPLGPRNQPQAVRIQSLSSWHEVEWLWGISYVQNFSPSWGLLLGRSQPRTQSMILK